MERGESGIFSSYGLPAALGFAISTSILHQDHVILAARSPNQYERERLHVSYANLLMRLR